MLLCRRWLQNRIFSISRQSFDSNPALHSRAILLSAQNSRALLIQWSQRSHATAAAAVATHVESSPLQLGDNPSSRDLAAEYEEPYKQRDLEKELHYLPDPLRLAESTAKALAKGKHEKAVDLVRLASRNMACTVSWNHIINYYMGRSEPGIAIKLYNEMKKRAQQPDAYTFTILLRGLAKNRHKSRAETVQHALTIYESMSAPNSPVEPSIIHANAVLQVCAYHGEVDTAFGIAAKLPSRGKGAPDNLTYTTILNGIRYGILDDKKRSSMYSEEQLESKTQQAIIQGRRIWVDIIEKWCKGDLFIDEELVCAIGRLLLLGSQRHDVDDVFSLVEQTMDIPRQIPRRGDPARMNYLIKLSRGHNEGVEAHQGPVLDEDPSLFDESHEISMSKNIRSMTPSSEFDPVPQVRNSIRSYAIPGRNTLSLLLRACLMMKAFKPSTEYRKMLTDPAGAYKVIPDSENVHMNLRILRSSRGSRAAAELVESMTVQPGDDMHVQPKTFRIAMSACVRDSKNHKVGSYAERILKMMSKGLEKPDLKTCQMYLQVISRDGIKGKWNEQKAALNLLDDLIGDYGRLIRERKKDAKSAFGRAEGEPDATNDILQRKKWSGQPGMLASNPSEEVVEFVRKLIGVYDKVLQDSGESLLEQERRDLKRKRSMFSAFVQRVHYSTIKVDNKVPKKTIRIVPREGEVERNLAVGYKK